MGKCWLQVNYLLCVYGVWPVLVEIFVLKQYGLLGPVPDSVCWWVLCSCSLTCVYCSVRNVMLNACLTTSGVVGLCLCVCV